MDFVGTTKFLRAGIGSFKSLRSNGAWDPQDEDFRQTDGGGIPFPGAPPEWDAFLNKDWQEIKAAFSSRERK